jgi:hypothetical protein
MSERDDERTFPRAADAGGDWDDEVRSGGRRSRAQHGQRPPSSARWGPPELDHQAAAGPLDAGEPAPSYEDEWGDVPYPGGDQPRPQAGAFRPPSDPWSGWAPAGPDWQRPPFPRGGAWAAPVPFAEAFVRYGWEMMRLGQSLVASLQQVLGGFPDGMGPSPPAWYPRDPDPHPGTAPFAGAAPFSGSASYPGSVAQPGPPIGFAGEVHHRRWEPPRGAASWGGPPRYDAPRPWPRGPSPAQGITIEVVSRRRCRSSVDLAGDVHAGVHVMPLESSANDAPPIRSVELTMAGDRPLVTIEIGDDQPPGHYGGAIVDPHSGRPVGEIVVRIE